MDKYWKNTNDWNVTIQDVNLDEINNGVYFSEHGITFTKHIKESSYKEEVLYAYWKYTKDQYRNPKDHRAIDFHCFINSTHKER